MRGHADRPASNCFAYASVSSLTAWSKEGRQVDRGHSAAAKAILSLPTRGRIVPRSAMKILDLTFGWLLVVGSLLHAMGSVASYGNMPLLLVWSLSGTLAGLLLASLNLLRAGRPGDRVLAWVSFTGCLGWIAVALAFGKVSGNLLDVRALTHAINAAVLAVMSLRTAFDRVTDSPGLPSR
jgi:hypothetical protein